MAQGEYPRYRITGKPRHQMWITKEAQDRAREAAHQKAAASNRRRKWDKRLK